MEPKLPNILIIEEWIAALRSDKYKQGKKRLRHGDNFCCLGVLCDIANKHGIGQWVPDDGENAYAFTVGDKTNHGTLPAPIMKWAGLNTSDPAVSVPPQDPGNSFECLTNLNDTGWTFKQIADLIELEWRSL